MRSAEDIAAAIGFVQQAIERVDAARETEKDALVGRKACGHVLRAIRQELGDSLESLREALDLAERG